MSWFCFGKKKEKGAPACCSGKAPEGKKAGHPCCRAVSHGNCTVKVLGSGCKSCHALYENMKAAVENMGIAAEVEYVTDMEKIMGYGVMSMPAVVVNEKVVSMGKVLKTAEAEKLLRSLGC